MPREGVEVGLGQDAGSEHHPGEEQGDDAEVAEHVLGEIERRPAKDGWAPAADLVGGAVGAGWVKRRNHAQKDACTERVCFSCCCWCGSCGAGGCLLRHEEI